MLRTSGQSGLIDSLDKHLAQYVDRKKSQGSYMGLGYWFYSFPLEEFEKHTLDLVKKVSANLSATDLKGRVQQLCFTVVPDLDKGEIKAAIHQIIAENKDFQNLLSDAVRRYREEKLANRRLIDKAAHRLDRRIEKARLAVNLGYRGESAGTGMSGATFLRSITGKRLGLFKVSNDHQSLWKTLHDGAFRNILANQPCYLNSCSKAGVQAEEAAYIVSSFVGFDLVPPTKLTEFGGISGSFQLLVPKVEGKIVAEFASIVDRFEKNLWYSTPEIQMFQIFAVFDYLIGNLDRHCKNWFVAYTEERSRVKLHRIFAIDHDRAFIHTNPSSYLGLKSQYFWKNAKIALKPMTYDTKQFIQTHFQPDQISQIMEAVESRMPGFFTREIRKSFEERALVLLKIAESDEDFTFQGIGNLRTDRKIQLFLSH